ncbi:ORF161 [Staphylococcus phage 53]|uniref:ORF161 n=1 Tax=Staphylococcus phage 53 TaxID=2908098 RepID=Q4ZDL2_9CAUD|nr:ORF161 [Staphylococcus phage 53]AAX90906.1 ORF161 [Staphylococcus phage 53]
MMQVSYIGTLVIQNQRTLITYKASISKQKSYYLNVVSI